MAKYKVTAARLNIRKTAKKDSKVLRIEENTILEATSAKNGWIRLKGSGYVMQEFTEEIAE